MYTHINLDEWNMSMISYDEIYQYLSSNRHVANYIRTLDITIVYLDIDDSSQWYIQVPSILQMLPSSLEKITLSSVVHIGASGIIPIAWSDLPATFRKAFLDCLWSPNIIEVSMERIGGFPLSIFNPCTRLKKLSLLQVKCTPTTSDAQFPPQIDSLMLSRSEDLATIVSWAKTGQDLRSLNFRLDYRVDQRVGYGQLIGLLDNYSDNLTKLQLDFQPLCRFTFYARNL